MKTSAAGHHPRRQDVLRDYLGRAVTQTPFTELAFAKALALAYSRLVPADDRSFKFALPDEQQDADRYLNALDAIRKRVTRYISGSLHIPIELEEAWVDALPQPYRSQCARALVQRMGFAGVRVRIEAEANGLTDLASVGQLSGDLGMVLQTASRMLDDGVFGPEDAALAPEALEQLNALGAHVLAVAQRIREQCA